MAAVTIKDSPTGKQKSSEEIIINGPRAVARRTGRRKRNNNNKNNNGKANRQMQGKPQNYIDSIAEFSLHSVLSPPVLSFCEAVSNPFGAQAIGAVWPDNFDDMVIPATDRLDLDLTYNDVTADGSELTTGWQFNGIFVFFLPRCLAAGWIQSTESLPFIYNRNWLGFSEGNIDMSIINNLYNIGYCGIFTNGTETVLGIVVSGAPVAAVKFVQLNRFVPIYNTCARARVIGAGIKLWSEASPINTSGYCYGGLINHGNLISTIYDEPTLDVQQYFRFLKRFMGLGGCTVRYSPLQSPEQAEKETVKLPSSRYRLIDADGLATVTTNPAAVIVYEQGVSSPAVNDINKPGDYIPVIAWRFNPDESYALKLSVQVHVDCTPNGTNPFQIASVPSDPVMNNIAYFLANHEQFPMVAKGHSFTSFIKKARHVVAKGSKYASHFAKFMALLDKFGSQVVA